MADNEVRKGTTKLTKGPEKSHKERLENGLTIKQMNAADLLAMGRKVQEVADISGVSRHQIWKWQKNPYFIAAISKQRGEIWQNSKRRLQVLVDKSVGVIEEAVDSGDVKAAIEVLKIVGLHGNVGAPPARVSVDDVITTQASKFIDDLLGQLPSDDPMAALSYRLQMRPTLIREQYQDLKDNLTLPEEEDEKEAKEEAAE